jgi:hypothetical protein
MRHPVQFLKTFLLRILLAVAFLGYNCLKKDDEQYNYFFFLLQISFISLDLIFRTYFNSLVTP